MPIADSNSVLIYLFIYLFWPFSSETRIVVLLVWWYIFHKLCKKAIVVNIKSDIPEIHKELRGTLFESEFKEIWNILLLC